jgi:hypothetical protein
MKYIEILRAHALIHVLEVVQYVMHTRKYCQEVVYTYVYSTSLEVMISVIPKLKSGAA